MDFEDQGSPLKFLTALHGGANGALQAPLSTSRRLILLVSHVARPTFGPLTVSTARSYPGENCNPARSLFCINFCDVTSALTRNAAGSSLAQAIAGLGNTLGCSSDKSTDLQKHLQVCYEGASCMVGLKLVIDVVVLQRWSTTLSVRNCPQIRCQGHRQRC